VKPCAAKHQNISEGNQNVFKRESTDGRARDQLDDPELFQRIRAEEIR
jgi:hypothetical protein